ncbi:SpoIIE family protein phosphatase [Streptomyces sp. 8L]|uniref:SpoIIE family protein phosphatase n=1 Tax=Streptomyces sp. 8L TaxID=2877242 RepID=UPI001CD584D0|nr:SpoIIE family protein phosphatase [Streptomyces sp. 8L]MCA1220881.1 SpoIIE family protein phosphatase [Streptomyces sp. 8L]
MAESIQEEWAEPDATGLAEAATAVVDAEGTILAWTAVAERARGPRAADVVGRSVTELLAGGDTGRAAVWQERARARQPWSGLAYLRSGSGAAIKVLVEVQPLLGDDRTDWLVSATDPSGVSAWPPARSPVAAALLARAPVGLSIWDTDLRCVWLNSTAARQDGLLRRQRLGRLMTEVQPGAPGREIVDAMRQVLKTGEPVVEREYTWRVPGEEEDRVLSSTYFRLDGADGQPMGVCNMATDIEKSLARQHLLTLGEVGSRIGTTLDVIQTSQELADAAVPLLADYVTVDLGDTVPLGDEPLKGPAAGASVPVFRRAGMASVHQGVPESPWRVGEPVFVPSTSPFTRALLSGETHFEPVLDTSLDTWLGRDPQRARTAAETGMHSLIIVPLKARGVILGEAVFIRTENRTPFSRDDLLLIEELAERAALSLDNARRYTREREAAVALQRNLLPDRLWGGPAVQLASRYLPADIHEGVGGDWFDVIPLPDARVGLMIGDVVGHGINAAALMGQLRTVMGTLADLDLPPEALLARLDRRVLQMTGEGESEGGPAGPVMSCTCAYAVYDPVTRRCTFASAGHPPPAIRLPDGTVSFVSVPPGPPIGLGTAAYRSITVELPEDSVVALYTDGLVETRTADIDDGLGRLAEALSWSAPSLEALCSHVTVTLAPRRARRARAVRAVGEEAGGGARQLPRSEDDVALLLAGTRVLSPREAAAQRRP